MELLGRLVGGEDMPFDCAAASDSNADGTVNLTDAVVLLGWLFGSGPPPAVPFPACGPVPAGGLECREGSPACE